MNKQKYDIVDIAEDISKEGYSIGVFASKAFYHVSGINALSEAMTAYSAERFKQRLEDFAFEHNKLSENEKKEFYNNLKSNKQNLNLLYEFVEKARTSTYDLHAKILAKLSANLVKNGDLNYHEKTLLSNIDILNDEDFIKFYEVLKNSNIEINVVEKEKIQFPITTYMEYYIFENLEKAGLIVRYSRSGGMNFAPPDEEVLKDKYFYIHNFTKEIFLFLKSIFEEKK